MREYIELGKTLKLKMTRNSSPFKKKKKDGEENLKGSLLDAHEQINTYSNYGTQNLNLWAH